MLGTGPALPANHMPAHAATEVSNAIGRITAGNMFGPPGGIPGLQHIFGWRVDRQNAPGNTINLSVQRNGIGAPSTVASVFVPTRYNLAPPPPHADPGAVDAFHARMRELERAVRRGLEESFVSYAAPAAPPHAHARVISRFEVTGDFSA
ncbi:MAG TPA: hypothetical protein VFS20_30790 [Longimicrobium sp.]|nr:hypothetical protein [Longimicrobium sp.]